MPFSSSVKYTGRHEGVEFETREVTFTQGEGDKEGIIPGIEIATKKMKKGERDQLTIAAKYAYGEEGCSELNIPPSATLDYDVEMISFEKVIVVTVFSCLSPPPPQFIPSSFRWPALKRSLN